MTKTALLFPGQGAQFVGMGKDLAEAFPRAKEVFHQADEILGFELSKICFDGPSEELDRTDISQPAILAHSWAVVEVLGQSPQGQALLGQGSVTAGLSLGEYSALAAAGSMSWEDALRLVRARGQYMQEACDLTPSTMASVIGLDREKLAGVVETASADGVVVMANFNAPGQIVISGEVQSVQKAVELAKDAGAKLVKELSVAGAFHSPLMEPAREKLAAKIELTEFHAPNHGVVANVDASEHRDPAVLKSNLVAQLTSPVLWADSMQKLVDDGYENFIELGPGVILAGLLKRVSRSAKRVSIGTADSVTKVIEE